MRQCGGRDVAALPSGFDLRRVGLAPAAVTDVTLVAAPWAALYGSPAITVLHPQVVRRSGAGRRSAGLRAPGRTGGADPAGAWGRGGRAPARRPGGERPVAAGDRGRQRARRPARPWPGGTGRCTPPGDRCWPTHGACRTFSTARRTISMPRPSCKPARASGWRASRPGGWPPSRSVKRAMRALPETLTYNDFHWTNLALSRQARPVPRAVVYDYHLLGIGPLRRLPQRRQRAARGRAGGLLGRLREGGRARGDPRRARVDPLRPACRSAAAGAAGVGAAAGARGHDRRPADQAATGARSPLRGGRGRSGHCAT